MLPLLHGEAIEWRDYVICESDYSGRPARVDLGLDPWDARSFMIRTERWKYVLHQKHRAQLFALVADPNALPTFGADTQDQEREGG